MGKRNYNRLTSTIVLIGVAACGLGPAVAASQAPVAAASALTGNESVKSSIVEKPGRTIIDDMQTIMFLLNNHDKISFTVKLIPGGVMTTNTSKVPLVAKAIQQHAADMKMRNEEGINVRPADPLFVELIRRHKEIKVRLKNIPDGVIEYETSADPQVTLLIRSHTKTVAGFVRYGLPRAQEPSPIPKGYHAE